MFEIRQAERAKLEASQRRDQFNEFSKTNKVDQDELWEENLMRQMKAYEVSGLDEAREKLKKAKKLRKKEKKKKEKTNKEKKEKKVKKHKSNNKDKS